MPIKRLTPELVADICRNYRDLSALNLSHNRASLLCRRALATARTGLPAVETHPILPCVAAVRACGSPELVAIEHLEPLAGQLTALDCSYNQLSGIDTGGSVARLTRLTSLSLAHNEMCVCRSRGLRVVGCTGAAGVALLLRWCAAAD